MLVLAIDTSTPAVTAGVVSLSAPSPDAESPGTESPGTESPGTVETLAVRVTVNPRAHAEVLTPHVLECLAEAGLMPAELNAVVVGVGPGPYTGLRVGMATGAAFGDALGVPVYGVCSLDAIAAAVPTTQSLLVVTDARRREIYWARYDGGVRIERPAVNSAGDVDPSPSTLIAGSASHVDFFDLPVGPGRRHPHRPAWSQSLLARFWPDRFRPRSSRCTSDARTRRPSQNVASETEQMKYSIEPMNVDDAERCGELERALFAGDGPWSAQAFVSDLPGARWIVSSLPGNPTVTSSATPESRCWARRRTWRPRFTPSVPIPRLSDWESAARCSMRF